MTDFPNCFRMTLRLSVKLFVLMPGLLSTRRQSFEEEFFHDGASDEAFASLGRRLVVRKEWYAASHVWPICRGIGFAMAILMGTAGTLHGHADHFSQQVCWRYES